uniref:Uncharacterized protein n=1 Tax=Arundo donax TaxID=35708 RepID=A0A0A8YKS8_ARUDO
MHSLQNIENQKGCLNAICNNSRTCDLVAFKS